MEFSQQLSKRVHLVLCSTCSRYFALVFITRQYFAPCTLLSIQRPRNGSRATIRDLLETNYPLLSSLVNKLFTFFAVLVCVLVLCPRTGSAIACRLPL